MGNFLSMGTTLLGEGNFVKSGDIGSKQPISIVSTSQPQGFDATSQTSFFGDIYTKDAINSILSPSVKADYSINNPFGKNQYFAPALNIKTALGNIADPVLTILPDVSQQGGTIWSVLGKTLDKVLDTGFNILTSKFTQKPTVQTVANVSTGTKYEGVTPNALETHYPSVDPFASMISSWINPLNQATQQKQIQTGIQPSNNIPLYVVIGVVAIILVVLLMGRK